MLRLVSKDPDAKLPFGFEWKDWLPAGETIESSTWEITYPPGGGGLEIVTSTFEAAGTVTTVWLQGGTVGKLYAVANTITTAGGYKDRRTFDLEIENT
jgi:hypothetical protein